MKAPHFFQLGGAKLVDETDLVLLMREKTNVSSEMKGQRGKERAFSSFRIFLSASSVLSPVSSQFSCSSSSSTIRASKVVFS
jgi:hypothetical protein